MRQKIDDVLAQLTRESKELRSDKTDRATLAALLTEMAMRLNNELNDPRPRRWPQRVIATRPEIARRADDGARRRGCRRRAGVAPDDPPGTRAGAHRRAASPPRRSGRARAADIGAVLPQVLLRHAHDPQFTRALAPPLEQAITTSVRRNPKPLADALFPVMGPAIRKAVAASLAGMVESLNRTLEHSFSRRSISWRLEAMRTGQVVRRESCCSRRSLYRVEQVFLIDRKSGLLLQHVHAGAAGMQDADMVSGMLTAIRDFVQDSFRVSDSDSLESLEVGELSVWIEPGPHAIVAAVIRGSAPRDSAARCCRTPSRRFISSSAEALESFDGDASTLDGCRPIARRVPADAVPRRRAQTAIPRRLAAGRCRGARVARLGRLRLPRRSREARYLEALRAEPGITVVSSRAIGRQARRLRPARSARPRSGHAAGSPAPASRRSRRRPMGAVLRARSAARAGARARYPAAADGHDARC